MKKSHRKDVIIARIIFACIMLVLVVLIAVGASVICKHAAKNKKQAEQTETQTENKTTHTESETVGDDLEKWATDNTETEETETAEPTIEEEPASEEGGEDAQTVLRAQCSVNVRSGSGTAYPVIGGIASGEEVILLEEGDDGWGHIQIGELNGYVYLEYFLIVE